MGPPFGALFVFWGRAPRRLPLATSVLPLLSPLATPGEAIRVSPIRFVSLLPPSISMLIRVTPPLFRVLLCFLAIFSVDFWVDSSGFFGSNRG